MTRQDGRAFDELRPIKITPDFVKFAEGSCLIQCGDTMVLCCASVEDRVPPHVPEGTGWVTAEYSMLPRANRERSKRDIAKLKLSPRSAEIQRLVGRSLRAAVDLAKLGEHTITIDCDVLQGDGGTRTASVTGGFVALALACRKLVEEGVAHLPNVVLHDSGPYIISNATFPSYFLKDEAAVIDGHARLDLAVFTKIAAVLNITARYVGEEPASQVTGLYNQIMCEQLPKAGIECVVVPRKEANGKAISASTVRQCLQSGDWDTLETLLPKTSLDYFRSPEAEPVLARIRNAGNVVHY